MPKIRRFLYSEKTQHGTIRYRFIRERGAKKITIKGLPGEAAFESRYNYLLNGGDQDELLLKEKKKRRSRHQEGTWADLVDQFMLYLDREVQRGEYAEGTRNTYAGILRQTTRVLGSVAVADFTRADIQNILRKLAPSRARHNNMLKAIRAVFRYAVEQTSLVEEDPTQGVKYKSIQTNGHKEWSVSNLRQYLSFHKPGSTAYLALVLLLHTACRRSDLVKLGPGNLHEIDGDFFLEFQQQKKGEDRGSDVSVPVDQDFIDLLNMTPTGEETFLVTAYGKPYSPKGFGNRMKKWVREAGLTDDIATHGVRKSVGVLMAEAGCSIYQIMAVHGHSSPKASEVYTRAASRRMLAKQGVTQANLRKLLQ